MGHQWLTYYTSYFSLFWFLSPNFPQAFLRAAAPSNSSRSFKLLWLWPINDHPRKITSIWYPRTRSLYWQLEQSWQTVLLLTWNPSRGWALSKDQRLHMDPTTTSKLPSVIESTVFVTLTLLRSWTDAMIVVLCRSDSTWSRSTLALSGWQKQTQARSLVSAYCFNFNRDSCMTTTMSAPTA